MWKDHRFQTWNCSYCQHVHDPEAIAINKIATLTTQLAEAKAELVDWIDRVPEPPENISTVLSLNENGEFEWLPVPPTEGD